MPRVIITDKLKSYGAAKREILPGVEHRQHRYLNNRAENSHQPTRQRERHLQGFKQGLGNHLITPEPDIGGHIGRVVRREHLGGVLSYYYREAA